MAQYIQEQIGFLDKTSKDRRTPSRGYGQSKKGTEEASLLVRLMCFDRGIAYY
jgi:hypothetical protein